MPEGSGHTGRGTPRRQVGGVPYSCSWSSSHCWCSASHCAMSQSSSMQGWTRAVVCGFPGMQKKAPTPRVEGGGLLVGSAVSDLLRTAGACTVVGNPAAGASAPAAGFLGWAKTYRWSGDGGTLGAAGSDVRCRGLHIWSGLHPAITAQRRARLRYRLLRDARFPPRRPIPSSKPDSILEIGSARDRASHSLRIGCGTADGPRAASAPLTV
ncbi:hypothetical protein C8K36_102435 [Rhodococcus sp. OK519]|nr:hypothetical protein C8K36_102435 [Rhodococcus sp. OK519]